ncbi:carbohydrate sulfotransferase 5-like [Ascaphus truei]|uniref:carbohydrate sulfotransferase 5-like n=1 Tax=Ascaphus truei TaxID=8439 RepID=UPI003F5A6B7C
MLHHNPPPHMRKQDRMHILILSSWRSGSSLAGQIFSQHPDVFYLMEPAWHVWSTMYQDRAKVLHMAVRDLVRSTFLCDMSVFDAYMPSTELISNLFQWETSRALCSPPACNFFKRGDIISQKDCKSVCAKYPFETIEKACKTYSHIVLKEVRFFDLNVLYPLLRDPSLNLKILHLVRDPRGVFHSRERSNSMLIRDSNIIVGASNNKGREGMYKVMEEICKSHIQIYQTAQNANVSILQSRYIMVRYEDIVNQPVEKARQMYQFAKLRFTPQLKTWIYNMTHGKGRGRSFVITSRDALKVSQAWRDDLPFKTTQRVQNICSAAMNMLGYRFVLTEEEQKNISLDLLLPNPQETNGNMEPFSLQ